MKAKMIMAAIMMMAMATATTTALAQDRRGADKKDMKRVQKELRLERKDMHRCRKGGDARFMPERKDFKRAELKGCPCPCHRPQMRPGEGSKPRRRR